MPSVLIGAFVILVPVTCVELCSSGCEGVCVVVEPYHKKGEGGIFSGGCGGCDGVGGGVEDDVAAKATSAARKDKGCE